MAVVQDAHQAARRAANSEGAEWWARFGFVARGFVYLVVGALALRIAWTGAAGEEASKDGALRAIAEQPFSGVLLTLLAVGLGGYALWQLSEAAWGKRDETDDRKRTAKRLAAAGKAAIYLTVLASTIRFIGGGPDAGGGAGGKEAEESWTAWLLGLPAGRLLAGAAALVLLVMGVWLVRRGLMKKYEKRLDTSDMGPVTGRVVDVLGVAGLTGRGALVGFVGFLVLRAALDHDASEAAGIDGALRTIAVQPFGRALITALAVGLVCYGLYSWVEARFRRL